MKTGHGTKKMLETLAGTDTSLCGPPAVEGDRKQPVPTPPHGTGLRDQQGKRREGYWERSREQDKELQYGSYLSPGENEQKVPEKGTLKEPSRKSRQEPQSYTLSKNASTISSSGILVVTFDQRGRKG